MQQAAAEAIASLPPPELGRVAIENRDLQLVFRHDCLYAPGQPSGPSSHVKTLSQSCVHFSRCWGGAAVGIVHGNGCSWRCIQRYLHNFKCCCCEMPHPTITSATGLLPESTLFLRHPWQLIADGTWGFSKHHLLGTLSRSPRNASSLSRCQLLTSCS